MPAILQVSPAPPRRSTSSDGDFKEDDPLFMSVDFRMYCYKVLPCGKRFCHDWSTCPFAHFSERAKRRDPRGVKYTAIACPEMKKGEDCPRGDKCPYAHNVFEYWLHPTRYRTRMCRDGTSCTRKVCFFAHKPEELRVPPCRPSLPIADDAWDGFGSEDTGMPATVEETAAKMSGVGNSAVHRRALSVPLEFLANIPGQGTDPFKVERPPPRACSMSESRTCDANTLNSLLQSMGHQAPQLPVAADTNAEDMTRTLLANLSLSSMPEVHGRGQTRMMHLPPRAPATSFGGVNTAIQPMLASAAPPAVSMGAPSLGSGQVVDLPVADTYNQGAGFLHGAMCTMPSPFQDFGHVQADGMGDVGGYGVEDLVQAILALQPQQQCDMGMAPGVDGCNSAGDASAAAALLSQGWPGIGQGPGVQGNVYYPPAIGLEGVSGLL
ncbi:unnamed protein product [Ostreobium quekettii]|uniref:C3H1-type domain-containing protein n=1 Tax=Ostreobium quekettii TaxID=121088 RepID=A0A8S1J3S0_9CHLO|nr:unnamed protein product [Ostreobium quekettii]